MTTVTTATYTDIQRIYNALPNIGSATNVSSTQLAQYAGDVEAKINVKLAKKYSIPFASVPPVLCGIATDLAVHKTLLRMFSAEALADSEWPDKWKEANELLDELASGELTLLDASNNVIAGRTDVSVISSNTDGYLPTFTELDSTEQIVDRDKLDDLRSDRNI